MKKTGIDIVNFTEKLEKKIQQTVLNVIGDKESVTEEQISQIYSTINNILNSIKSDNFVNMPMVDINHKIELQAIDAMIKRLETSKKTTTDKESLLKIDKEIQLLNNKYVSLASEANSAGLLINFKEPSNFSPYIWVTKGEYVN